MATATSKNGKGPEIRKLAADLETGNPTRMEAAVRKISVFCVENGLSFSEAMAEAFGRDDGAAQLEEENAKLREEVERRKQGGDELAEALDQARKEIALLERQSEPVGRVWSPKTLLLILAGVISARLVLYIALGEGPSVTGTAHTGRGFAPWLANMLLVLSGAWLLAQWHRAQNREMGWGQLVMKWVLLGPGFFVAAVVFFDGPPWDASMFHREPVPALFVSVFTMLLVLSKFTERIAKRVPEAFAGFSVRRAISWVFGWFF